MSRYDYEIAKELIATDHVSFTSLIMAAIIKAPEHYKVFRNYFPEICREYYDRWYGVDGFLRGESKSADDEYRTRDLENLRSSTRTDELRRRSDSRKPLHRG